MAFGHAVPSLPYELLAKEEENHAAYGQSEYRDILALVECCSRNMGAYFKYFPQDYKNRDHMNRFIMPEFFDLQDRVEKFAKAVPPPRTEEEELKELRYLAQKVLARMAPAIEAYWLSPPTRESPWCPPGSLPHIRQVKPHDAKRCLAKTISKFGPHIQARMTMLRETEMEKLRLRRTVKDLRKGINRLCIKNNNL